MFEHSIINWTVKVNVFFEISAYVSDHTFTYQVYSVCVSRKQWGFSSDLYPQLCTFTSIQYEYWIIRRKDWLQKLSPFYFAIHYSCAEIHGLTEFSFQHKLDMSTFDAQSKRTWCPVCATCSVASDFVGWPDRKHLTVPKKQFSLNGVFHPCVPDHGRKKYCTHFVHTFMCQGI